MGAQTVAVLITAAGRVGHLRRTLGGLSRQSRPPDEVVVVDLRPSGGDGSRPALPCAVQWVDHPPTASAKSLPLASGRNLAAASSRADHLVFLDVDCLPAPDLVERYLATLRAHPDALACGPVRYLRESWRSIVEAEAPSPAALDKASDHHPDRPRLVSGQVVVANADHDRFWSLSFGVTRAVWDSIGGFDAGFVGYGAEDTDLGRRAGSLGVSLAWFGGGTAYHQWHPPTRDDPDRLVEMIANAHRFRDRWGCWPMGGWFERLREQGLVRFDPARDVLEPVPVTP
ncbi:MAG: glycosyltransferase family 2 protein [Ilumatobacteraceae bacterium]